MIASTVRRASDHNEADDQMQPFDQVIHEPDERGIRWVASLFTT